ncbi:MAG TPA: anti-sigma factor antagonist [Bacteroidetes bacterium]|nr:anti-sigma factor antagonist [Bacteroidota bacterium]
MQIKEEQQEKYISLAPIGDLDANSSMQMDEVIQNKIDAGVYNIHIDCSGLQYISSAGLGVFISFMDELSANGGKFVFSDMTENILKVFQLLGLESLMTIVNNKNEVLTNFS